jgi:hypothetical protein
MSWGGGGSLRDGWLDFAWRAYESCVACVTDLSLQYFEAREPAQPIPRLGSFGSLKLQKSHITIFHSVTAWRPGSSWYSIRLIGSQISLCCKRIPSVTPLHFVKQRIPQPRKG